MTPRRDWRPRAKRPTRGAVAQVLSGHWSRRSGLPAPLWVGGCLCHWLHSPFSLHLSRDRFYNICWHVDSQVCCAPVWSCSVASWLGAVTGALHSFLTMGFLFLGCLKASFYFYLCKPQKNLFPFSGLVSFIRRAWDSVVRGAQRSSLASVCWEGSGGAKPIQTHTDACVHTYFNN